MNDWYIDRSKSFIEEDIQLVLNVIDKATKTNIQDNLRTVNLAEILKHEGAFQTADANPNAAFTRYRDHGLIRYNNELGEPSKFYLNNQLTFGELIIDLFMKRAGCKNNSPNVKPLVILCIIFDYMMQMNIDPDDIFLSFAECYEYLYPCNDYASISYELVEKIISERTYEYSHKFPRERVQLESNEEINLGIWFNALKSTPVFLPIDDNRKILKPNQKQKEFFRFISENADELSETPTDSNKDLYNYYCDGTTGILEVLPEIAKDEAVIENEEDTKILYEYLFGYNKTANFNYEKYFKRECFGVFFPFIAVPKIAIRKIYYSNKSIGEALFNYANAAPDYNKLMEKGEFNLNNPVKEGFSLTYVNNIPDDEKIMEKSEYNNSNNIYKLAAQVINEHITTTGYNFDVDNNELAELYKAFTDKFSIDLLKQFSGEEMLNALYYTSNSNNDSLCWWLEFHPQIKKYFGSIAGGSSFKFGLFQRKTDNIWVTGSPKNPLELTLEEAIQVGTDIRDSLVKGAEIIDAFGDLVTVEDYEKLDDGLNKAIGKYASFAWFHKYYHMIYPTKLSPWHSTEWQSHILYGFGIKPSDKYYARSGQLTMIANYADLSTVHFSNAAYNKFGDIKHFFRIGTSNGDESKFNDWEKAKIVAIGWNNIGTLENYVQGDSLNRKEISDALEIAYYSDNKSLASRKAGELSNFYGTTADTVFVAMDGERLIALGDNVGNYYFDNRWSFAHRKSIKWHHCFTDEDRLPNKAEGLRTSCYPISDANNLIFLYNKYYNSCETEVIEEVEEIKVIQRNPRVNIIHPLNQIIYGAPGTGKTYSSIDYALAIAEHRPVDLSKKTSEERKSIMSKYEELVKTGRITFTTFHQSYGYEEFIQGIRPDSSSGSVSFKKVDGIFKKIADKAINDETNDYVIIVDEINRGNISKIFGELITLIEEDKRCGELNQLSVTLPLGDNFTVPNNLYIIGTMNSADKSISLIDTALRRRFAFIEMAPNEEVIDDSILKGILSTLNAYLKKELRSTDLLIGHSFFIGKTVEALGDIMNRNIIPLLYEYFYDDEAKVKKALECITDTDFAIDTDYQGRIKVIKKV